MTTPPALELPSAHDFLVVRGLIAVLEAEGTVEYHDDGEPFPAGFPGVAAFYGGRPSAPDRVASFTPYAIGPDPVDAMDRLGVQVWLRYAGQNPRAVDNLAGVIRDTLHGLSYMTLSTGVSMSQCLRSSGSSLGQDAAKRWTRVENFYVDAEHQSPNRY